MIKYENLDIFGDGMKIYMDYILRQIKKNPDYIPHPIIRAFECALSEIDNCKIGEIKMGISQDGTKDNIYEPYAVVLEKKGDKEIEVKEIRNLKIDKELPIDFMITIFRLQMQLDKIEGDVVNPQQMVTALNAVISGNKYYALGDRWAEARDLFKLKMEKGELKLPASMMDSTLENELVSIRYETPWEDYSNRLRALIGGGILQTMEGEDRPEIVITSPSASKIEKFKVFDAATQFTLGKISDRFKNKEFKQEEDKEDINKKNVNDINKQKQKNIKKLKNKSKKINRIKAKRKRKKK